MATDGTVLNAAHADAGVPVDAPLIEITGTAPSAADAARAANAVARAIAAYANDANDAAGGTGAELALLTEAIPHATPASPSPHLSLATGTCAGAIIGSLALLTRSPAPHPTRRGSVPPQPAAASGATASVA
jgi:capsular polysaccharide biosynthesis protein